MPNARPGEIWQTDLVLDNAALIRRVYEREKRRDGKADDDDAGDRSNQRHRCSIA